MVFVVLCSAATANSAAFADGVIDNLLAPLAGVYSNPVNGGVIDGFLMGSGRVGTSGLSLSDNEQLPQWVYPDRCTFQATGTRRKRNRT
jgi:hypothetical protein